MAVPASLNPRVLVVEDDATLGQRVQAYLASHGIDATHAPDLGSARALLAKQAFDVVVLDLMLTDGDGLTLAREFAQHGGPPVVITSARIEEADRVLGLELGADDYLPKPYGFRELLARIRVVHRRRLEAPSFPLRQIASFGDWLVDLAAHTLTTREGRPVTLTEGEYGLLLAFVKNPHRVLTRAALLTLTSHDDAAVFDRTIDVLVARLRRKLRSESSGTTIQTVRGEGYRFSASVSWDDARER